MSVMRLETGWNGDVLGTAMSTAMSTARPGSAAGDMKPSEDWSPSKKFLCLVAASLASWAIVLTPIYALVQYV